MKEFKYLTPKTIKEAIKRYIEKPFLKSKYIAGGTDLLIKIKNKKTFPNQIISLKHINKHNKIKIENNSGNLIIGGLTTHITIEKSKLIKKKYKILNDAIQNIGSIQIRNIATIGGNIINAAPSADSVIPLIALGSLIKLQGKTGTRKIKLIDLYKPEGGIKINSEEILTEIIIPKQKFTTSGSYKKFTRREAMELPIISIGLVLSFKKNTYLCKKARICLGVAAPIPIRAIKAELFLKNKIITEKNLIKTGIIATNESKVRNSIRGKYWYRKELISFFIKKMGILAIKRIN